MIIIGLTGGIGSGKTTVSEYLISKGYKVIDADKIARELLYGKYSDPLKESCSVSALQQVVQAFGKEILFQDNTIDRKKLGNIVFNDTAKKEVLEKILHSEIFKIINHSIDEYKSRGEALIFLDAPLLFEVKLDALTAVDWLVDADDEIRIDRVMKRDNLTRKDIEDRIKNQMSREEKKAKADVVIDNSIMIPELYKRIDELLADLNC